MYASNLEDTKEAKRSAEVIHYLTEFLDHAIPLDGASHAEVDTYDVDIPMRYATLCATLMDGRKIRLRDSRNFAGWSGEEGRRSFLFRKSGMQIEIRTDKDQSLGRTAPGNMCDLILESSVSTVLNGKRSTGACEDNGSGRTGSRNATRKFVSPDGSQLVLS